MVEAVSPAAPHRHAEGEEIDASEGRSTPDQDRPERLQEAIERVVKRDGHLLKRLGE